MLKRTSTVKLENPTQFTINSSHNGKKSADQNKDAGSDELPFSSAQLEEELQHIPDGERKDKIIAAQDRLRELEE